MFTDTGINYFAFKRARERTMCVEFKGSVARKIYRIEKLLAPRCLEPDICKDKCIFSTNISIKSKFYDTKVY